ncbi:hypothetical protein [Croceicoccus estronivorus]|uniref:hypothetical protein n=1 Tax=Croceicoccus estronivorus TaxID=1172626 RepID=UPI0012E82FD5|nr:hypothetical protein [Croceicoccus estronivorus]
MGTKPGSARLGSTGEVYQQIEWRCVRHTRQFSAVAQQEGVTNNFCLLFNSIAFQGPSRPQAIGIAARQYASDKQMQLAMTLRLPDMRHFMDKVPLPMERRSREIVTIKRIIRMEMDVP